MDDNEYVDIPVSEELMARAEAACARLGISLEELLERGAMLVVGEARGDAAPE